MKNNEYISFISKEMDNLIRNQNQFSDPGVWWEDLKKKLQEKTDTFSKTYIKRTERFTMKLEKP